MTKNCKIYSTTAKYIYTTTIRVDMANEESSKFSSNPKVPPLKIVFNSHHNNAVISSLNEGSTKFSEKDDNSDDHLESREPTGRNSLETNEINQKQHKKSSKISVERNESDSGQTSSKPTTFSSSNSSTTTTTSTPDRSDSTTPSSESESLASTIIIENQNVKSIKNEINDQETLVSKQNSKCALKVSSSEKNSNNEMVDIYGKKSQDNIAEQSNDSSNAATKDQILNANQRITRSSQRAAQQSKTENQGELNGEDSITSESQDKIHESSRKVKRRKVEAQECEQDGSQTTTQPPVTMANICPSDYQLPARNSFELYRDIRKRPYYKLMKLSHTQPKIPHGFKDYLLNGGPYLLDGNKLGVGLTGARLEHLRDADQSANNGSISTSRAQLRMKLTNLQRLSPHLPSKQRHISYAIPRPADAPKTLQIGSPLYELFQDQEKARQQMRMQHLKERERSILASEQEILRAYNKAAIADMRQKFHLSACTYFYYQERYHYYLGEKSGSNKNTNSKEVPHSQDNSFLCIEGGEATKSIDNEHFLLKESSTEASTDIEQNAPNKIDGLKVDTDRSAAESSSQVEQKMDHTKTISEQSEIGGDLKSNHVQIDTLPDQDESTKSLDDQSGDSAPTSHSITKIKDSDDTPSFEDGHSEKAKDETSANLNKSKGLDTIHGISESINNEDNPTKSVTDEDLKVSNKEAFLNQLQEIDDKWDKIKRDMFVRHRNEADSLYAVQTLEWEWKAKEIGACDVRVSFKIEPESVPRVEVSALDY